MKIRSGFVSNSSSSSFIIAVPNYANLPIDECIPEMIRDRYNDAIEWNDPDDIKYWSSEFEKYRKRASEENLKFFSLSVDYGLEDTIYSLVNNLPGSSVIAVDD